MGISALRRLAFCLLFLVALPSLAQTLAVDYFGDGVTSDWTLFGSCWSESGGIFHCSTTPPNTPIAAIWTGGQDWTDYTVEADVEPFSTYQPSEAALVFRFDSEYPNDHYCECSLFRYQGTFLSLYCPPEAAHTISFPFTVSTWYKLRASVSGNSASCEVVGVPGAQVTGTFALMAPSGPPGLRSTHIASDFDNFRVIGPTSAAGHKIVFARGDYPNSRPWIADLDGSNAQQLADVALASLPRLASGTVVFMSDDYAGQGSAIYRMDAQPGAPVTKVPNTENIRTANGPNWDAIDLSPDGGRLVWAAPEPGDYYQNHNVFVMNLDGTDKVRILRDTGKHYTMLNWGETGRIVVQVTNVGNAYSQRPFTVRPDGSNLSQVVTDFAQNVHIGGPVGRAVMNWDQPYPQPLATMNNTFGDFAYAPGGVSGYGFLSWDPDQNRVYGEKAGDIYTVDLDTGAETLLVAAQGAPFRGGDVGEAASNQPPVADAGPDQSLPVGPNCQVEATLDGSGSYDPEGGALDYLWTWSGPDLTGPSPSVSLPLGSHSFELTVTDPGGLESSDEVAVDAVDATAPTASSVADPAVLWPPNHHMVDVDVAFTTSDACSSPVSCEIVSVSSSEATTGPGADWEILDADTVRLRAARDGSGPGRTYTITSSCSDSAGNATTTVSEVTVPPGAVVLPATQDAFLRQGASDTNEGGNDQLRIQSSGKNRVLVGFDLSQVEGSFVTSATLALTISDIADNWGPSGRTVSAHALLSQWAEGNGWTVGGNDRGEGPGTTWTCPTDAEIANHVPDCPGLEWDGGLFAPATGPGVLHTSGQTGEVDFDVTGDFAGDLPAGWLIQKDNEGQNGKVFYYSREGAATAGDLNLTPHLILSYD